MEKQIDKDGRAWIKNNNSSWMLEKDYYQMKEENKSIFKKIFGKQG